jgi:uncharacterized protein YqhQ
VLFAQLTHLSDQSGTSLLTLGGQAVIEGVMLRSPRFVSVAIRRPQGQCDIEIRSVPSAALSHKWLQAPFVRGIVALVEGMTVGTWALMVSAQAAHPDGVTLSPGRMRLVLARGLAISLLIFFLVPTVLARVLGGRIASPLGENALEGTIRLGLVLAFLALIGRIAAIQRVFQYHGAEHKVVQTYESGLPLVIESATKASRFHPRCGTSFLLMVVLVAIVVFALFGHPPLAIRLVERIAFLPIVAAMSYELMRAGQRYGPLRVLNTPGLWLQRLTTREPDRDQLAVALSALDAVLAKERPLDAT